jgi:hypothetical protein
MATKKAQQTSLSSIKNIINRQNEMEKSIQVIMENQVVLSNRIAGIIEFLNGIGTDDDEECDCESCSCGCNCEDVQSIRADDTDLDEDLTVDSTSHNSENENNNDYKQKLN